MASATLTTKGQVTIPKKIREALAIDKGDHLSFRLREDGVVEVVPETLDLLSLCETLKSKTKGVSVEDMQQAIETRGSRL